MKVLIEKIWTEPAAFLAAVSVGLNVTQVLVVHDRVLNAVVAALLIALQGGTTRALSRPVARRRK